ncbi:hypothetical protein SAMN06265795_103252 [Noviherbaspirillum humi]|uniref:Uncharacterized protein n=1 Tax=Noviherbaspirillum humi TaxID=1688639 RepID=A0A239FBJ9_9BURK|nr:hypothetical protein [Noviherbaspirillum humi]SNS53542.1 hypothetical protein SAMN06265795_103252 [Noviherbaspirillum humi]
MTTSAILHASPSFVAAASARVARFLDVVGKCLQMARTVPSAARASEQQMRRLRAIADSL